MFHSVEYIPVHSIVIHIDHQGGGPHESSGSHSHTHGSEGSPYHPQNHPSGSQQSGGMMSQSQGE